MAENKLHKVLLSILRSFHEVCINHNLKYYISDGTLLGAVRHKGFIPWDDDIDVSMPRPDYDIFIREATNWLPAWLKLSSPTNTINFPYTSAKIEHRDTFLLESEYQHLNRISGVNIDIFPLDGMPQGKLSRFCHFYRIYFVNRLNVLMHCNTNFSSIGKNPRNLIKAFLGILMQSVFNSDQVLRCFEKLCRKYSFEKSEFILHYDTSIHCPLGIAKYYFGKPTSMLFENELIWGLEHPHEYLKLIYGDYMKLPSEDNQKSNHDITFSVSDSPRGSGAI